MRRIGLIGIGVVLGSIAGGGLVWGIIPDTTTGVVTACYPTSGTSKGVIRVINAQAGETCKPGEASLRLRSTQCDGYPRAFVDWRGCDFHGAYLDKQYLSYARMYGINLAFASLSGTRLVGVDLRNANLGGARLIAADLRKTNFAGANLTGATLGGEAWTQLKGATGLTSAQLRSLTPSNQNWCGANLGPNLRYIDFGGLDLSGFDLHSADFSYSFVDGMNFTGANLSKTYFAGVTVKNSNFTNADLSCAGAFFPTNSIWNNTICPDGTNSNNNAGTCDGHLF